MTETELNITVAPYFQRLEAHLNANTIKLEVQPGNVYYVPTITSLGTVQRVPNTGGAFNLEPFQAGLIQDIRKTPEEKETYMLRRIISYVTASRIIADPDNIHKYLGPIVNEMLLSLRTARGFDHNTLNAGKFYANFKPGGKYVRDIENAAGFELRLGSDTWSCVNLNGNR